MTGRIYLGSSSKNIPILGPIAYRIEAELGLQVYRFWQPAFSFADLDQNWRDWSPQQAVEASTNPRAIEHFRRDRTALAACHAAVFVAPIGSDAGAEIGWAAANGKPVIMLHTVPQPGLMTGNWATRHVFDVDELIATLHQQFTDDPEGAAISVAAIPDGATPVLDCGYVRLLDAMGDDLAVTRAARVLPDAEWRDSDGPNTDRRLIRYMLQHGHTSPFEQVVIKFEVKAPIFVFRQWHRHRTQSPNEISARYSTLPDEFYTPGVELIGEPSAKNRQSRDIVALTPERERQRAAQLRRYVKHCEGAFVLYHDLLGDGWPRELARLCLPHSTYSRMVVTANLHNWLRFLHERLAAGAQYEIRVYAEAILQLITPIAPVCVAAWREGRADQGGSA